MKWCFFFFVLHFIFGYYVRILNFSSFLATRSWGEKGPLMKIRTFSMHSTMIKCRKSLSFSIGAVNNSFN